MHAQRFVEADQLMAWQIAHLVRLSKLFDVAATGINGPDRIRDLATDEFVVGIAGPEGNIRFALRQIEVTVAGYEFDPKLRMEGLESLDQRRLRHAAYDRLGARHPDHAGEVVGLIGHAPLEVDHRRFDALGVGQQFFAEFREAIA